MLMHLYPLHYIQEAVPVQFQSPAAIIVIVIELKKNHGHLSLNYPNIKLNIQNFRP